MISASVLHLLCRAMLQLEAYRSCVERHGEEACIMRFETLGMQEEKVFFHGDQVGTMPA